MDALKSETVPGTVPYERENWYQVKIGTKSVRIENLGNKA